MLSSSAINPDMQRQAYTDLNSLQAINKLGRSDKKAALAEVAKQFESIMMRQMMGSMRKANALFSEDNPLNSKNVEFYQSMFDDQLALTLSNSGGMGLAQALEQQLQQRYINSRSDDRTMNALPARNNSLTAVTAVEQSTPLVSEQDFTAPEDFVAELYGVAQQYADELNMPVELLISQAALETGWGKNILRQQNGQSSNNLFNIKADSRWQGNSQSVTTLEYRDGVAVKERANFRVYDSVQDSFRDYVDFIKSQPRYSAALDAQDPQSYMNAISAAGYATDPAYAEKVMTIFSSDRLQQAVTASQSLAALR